MSQFFEGVIQREKLIPCDGRGANGVLVQRNHGDVAASLLRGRGTGMVDQNLTHEASGEGEKLPAIFKRTAIVVVLHLTEVRFVNQRRWLQSVATRLALRCR